MTARRLMVVDDHPDFVSLVRRVGERREFSVETLTDSRAFAEAYRRFDPSVIMLDLFMPGKSGESIVRWLASSGNRAPVILTSGDGIACADAVAALGAIGTGFDVSMLVKPVGLAQMAAAIEQAGDTRQCAPA